MQDSLKRHTLGVNHSAGLPYLNQRPHTGMLHCPALGPPIPDPRHQHLLHTQALTLQRHIFARSGGWVVKGEWGIAERLLRLDLQRDFRGMFTLAIKCRLEPLLLSRFAAHLRCLHANMHQAQPQSQLQSLLDAGGPCMLCSLGPWSWSKWTKEGSGKAASWARHHLIPGAFVGLRGCFQHELQLRCCGITKGKYK